MKNKYIKKDDQFVIAVQILLQTEGFTYEKWGSIQTCKPGDWLVNNGGDIYTVDRNVFSMTYRPVGAGKFVKDTPVWAKIAEKSGSLKTQEGETFYQTGDYLVSNNEDGSDAYCIKAEKFTDMYRPLD